MYTQHASTKRSLKLTVIAKMVTLAFYGCAVVVITLNCFIASDSHDLWDNVKRIVSTSLMLMMMLAFSAMKTDFYPRNTDRRREK